MMGTAGADALIISGGGGVTAGNDALFHPPATHPLIISMFIFRNIFE